jgi:hypothetical protein
MIPHVPKIQAEETDKCKTNGDSIKRRHHLLTLRCQVVRRTRKEGRKSSIRIGSGEEDKGDNVAQLER